MYFGNNIGCNDWLRKNVCKIVCQINGINSLHFSIGHLSKLRKSIKITVVSDYWNYIYRQAFFFCKFAQCCIEFFNCCKIIIGLGFVKWSKANVGKTISANNDLRSLNACGSCHSDWCGNSWAESSWTSFLHTHDPFLKFFGWIFDRKFHSFLTLFGTVRHKELLIHEFISSNCHRILATIAVHRDLIVEGHNSDFPIWGSIWHVCDLLVNSSLKALHAANVCDVALTLKSLIRTVTELHEIFQFICFISFQWMLTLNWLRTAHRSWLINAKYNWHILLSWTLFVLNLGSSLKNEIYCITFWLFFLLDVDGVFVVAEFTDPHLITLTIFLLFNFAVDVENGFTFLANGRISRGQLSLVRQSLELNLKNVCVDLLPKNTSWGLLVSKLAHFLFGSETLNSWIVFAVREI